mmetsp:Transcript_23491/g.44625  ORF Transcript_23491/g.44625 Transcript_23491/m.44625 type:complete len:384 (-) Transcript_23491:2673-3824(-)
MLADLPKTNFPGVAPSLPGGMRFRNAPLLPPDFSSPGGFAPPPKVDVGAAAPPNAGGVEAEAPKNEGFGQLGSDCIDFAADTPNVMGGVARVALDPNTGFGVDTGGTVSFLLPRAEGISLVHTFASFNPPCSGTGAKRSFGVVAIAVCDPDFEVFEELLPFEDLSEPSRLSNEVDDSACRFFLAASCCFSASCFLANAAAIRFFSIFSFISSSFLDAKTVEDGASFFAVIDFFCAPLARELRAFALSAATDASEIFFATADLVMALATLTTGCDSVTGGASFFTATGCVAAFFWGGAFVPSVADVAAAAFFFGEIALRFFPFPLFFASTVASATAFSAVVSVVFSAAPSAFFALGWTAANDFPEESAAVEDAFSCDSFVSLTG